MGSVNRPRKEAEFKMSVSLCDAAMAGNVEEVLIRLNMGEDESEALPQVFNSPA